MAIATPFKQSASLPLVNLRRRL